MFGHNGVRLHGTEWHNWQYWMGTVMIAKNISINYNHTSASTYTTILQQQVCSTTYMHDLNGYGHKNEISEVHPYFPCGVCYSLLAFVPSERCRQFFRCRRNWKHNVRTSSTEFRGWNNDGVHFYDALMRALTEPAIHWLAINFFCLSTALRKIQGTWHYIVLFHFPPAS